MVTSAAGNRRKRGLKVHVSERSLRSKKMSASPPADAKPRPPRARSLGSQGRMGSHGVPTVHVGIVLPYEYKNDRWREKKAGGSVRLHNPIFEVKKR